MKNTLVSKVHLEYNTNEAGTHKPPHDGTEGFLCNTNWAGACCAHTHSPYFSLTVTSPLLVATKMNIILVLLPAASSNSRSNSWPYASEGPLLFWLTRLFSGGSESGQAFYAPCGHLKLFIFLMLVFLLLFTLVSTLMLQIVLVLAALH